MSQSHLDKILLNLRAGDTLIFENGIYDISFANNIPSGSKKNPLVLMARHKRKVEIKPIKAPRVILFSTFLKEPIHHVVFDGFVLNGINVTHDVVKITDGANHIKLINCEIKNAPGNGILTTNARSIKNKFINLEVHSNGKTDFNHGFYISTSENLIERCSIYANAGWGVHVYGGEPNNNNNIIRNNNVNSNARIGKRGDGIGLYSGEKHIAVDNEVWGNKTGITLNYGADNCKVEHNKVYKNTINGIYVGKQTRSCKIVNNEVSENKTKNIQVDVKAIQVTIHDNRTKN